LLIALLRDPVKYKAKPVGGPGVPGALFVEGERKNLKRYYAPPPPPVINNQGEAVIYTYDSNGLPVVIRNQPMVGYVGPDGYALVGPGAVGLGNQSAPPWVGQIAHDPGHAAAIVSANRGKGNNPIGSSTLASMLVLRGLFMGRHGVESPFASNTISIG